MKKQPMKKHQKQEHAKEELNKMAKKLAQMLIDKGFTVQRYDAYSTNSIYLKLDYGLCNSIRISDHNGKENLSYMYNLRSDINRDYVTRNGYTRYFVTFKNYKRIVNLALQNKWKKYVKAGSETAYNEIMNIEKNLNKNNKGFWNKCYLVN